MNRLERINKIDEMIARDGTVPVDAFLSALNISLATFKRDLDYLRTELNAPLVWNRSAGGYSYGKRKGKAATAAVPALFASARDTHALMAAYACLGSVRSGPLKASVDGLAARILSLLSAQGDAPAQIAKRISVSVHSTAAVVDESAVFPAIANALLKRRRIRVTSLTGRRRAAVIQELSPSALSFGADGWVLDAIDSAGGVRCTLKLADCTAVEVLNLKAR